MRVLSQNAKLSVLIFDEARVLARLKGLDFRGLLQEITDSHPNISLAFTGSMPGVLMKALSLTLEESRKYALDEWKMDI